MPAKSISGTQKTAGPFDDAFTAEAVLLVNLYGVLPVMPSNGPFADVQLGDLLKGDARAKEYANKVSKHYAESPQSIRNGSVHPALRPESTQVVLTDLDAGTSPPTTPTIRRTPTYPQ